MEILHRTEDAARRRVWRSRPPEPPARSSITAGFVAGPSDLGASVTPEAASALIAEADELLAGRWTMFGRPRTDMTADLDYFVDFVSGTRAPDDRYSLTIDHRDEAAVGNIKFVWEPARHHHLTILAAAYAV
ncbi:MAG: heparinase, partial [Actinomycetota bacterium]